ncbi:MAG: hypothetical protein DRO06_05015, partial [Thermoproteota archaeon]
LIERNGLYLERVFSNYSGLCVLAVPPTRALGVNLGNGKVYDIEGKLYVWRTRPARFELLKAVGYTVTYSYIGGAHRFTVLRGAEVVLRALGTEDGWSFYTGGMEELDLDGLKELLNGLEWEPARINYNGTIYKGRVTVP